MSTTDLDLTKKILENSVRKKILITNDINDAQYIINNYRDWRGITKPVDFMTPKNFKIIHEIKIDGISINNPLRIFMISHHNNIFFKFRIASKFS